MGCDDGRTVPGLGDAFGDACTQSRYELLISLISNVRISDSHAGRAARRESKSHAADALEDTADLTVLPVRVFCSAVGEQRPPWVKPLARELCAGEE